jgi:hypothetical protein
VSRTRCAVLDAAPQSRDPPNIMWWHGPGISSAPPESAQSAIPHSASKTRVNALLASAASGAQERANGYRFAKWQGKPISASRPLSPWNKQFCDFAAGIAGQTFTFDSLRYLNCPSNFIGHDHPNKPANGKRMIRQSVGGLAIRK